MSSEKEWKNQLYFGDNLTILREHVPDESVDLVYLDPPFNSNATYNVLFGEQDGSRSQAQIAAFEDTWEWGTEAEATFKDVVLDRPGKLADFLQALRGVLKTSNMMAYLTMMTPRLLELHRVLKSAGSLYLHCDPTASHYLKMLMDVVFSPTNFRNEITWKRRIGMSSAVHKSNRFGVCTDIILFYAKTQNAAFHVQYNKDSEECQRYIEERYKFVDEQGRRYRKSPLTNPAVRPNLQYEYKGYPPPEKGWAVSRKVMEEMDRQGRLVFPADKTRRIERKMYLDEYQGQPVQNLWIDVPFVNPMAQERLGYPTQKPEALLERIIKASSNEGDLILDPFCGCGTTINVAERLHRRWIGIDITHLAIALIKNRLHDTFATELSPYEVLGSPKDLSSAGALAEQDRYQFQWWALSLIDARPAQDKKKGADTGIDGYINFFDDNSEKAKKIIVQVKSGKPQVKEIRDFIHVVDRERAVIGVFITLEPPTKPMKDEALAEGYYAPEHLAKEHTVPRIQIITIAELLSGVRVRYPRMLITTFKKAERKYKEPAHKQDSFL